MNILNVVELIRLRDNTIQRTFFLSELERKISKTFSDLIKKMPSLMSSFILLKLFCHSIKGRTLCKYIYIRVIRLCVDNGKRTPFTTTIAIVLTHILGDGDLFSVFL